MVSALLLNYKRPQNLPKIIDAIRAQSVPTEVIVWNNGSTEVRADLVITASKPLNCYVRFLTVGLARNPYIWIQDDDWIITDTKLFSRLIPLADTYRDSFLTAEGRVLSTGTQPYQGGKCAPPGPAVVANTGYSFARTDAFEALPPNPLYCKKRLLPGELRWADDMWVSAHVKPFVCPEIANGITPYNEGAVGVSKESGHMEARNSASARLFQGRTL